MIHLVRAGLKRLFLTGLLVVVPLYFTYYIISVLVNSMDRLLSFLPTRFHPDTYLPFHVPGLGVIFTIVLIFLAGIFATNFFGKRLVELWEGALTRIPFIRTVYSASKQLMEAFFVTNREGFRRVVLVEYPRKGVYVLGFVTGVTGGEVQRATPERLLNIFLPTTPNPTSGFYILVPEKDTIPLKMSVEDAFKLIISGGMVAPREAEGIHHQPPAAKEEKS